MEVNGAVAKAAAAVGAGAHASVANAAVAAEPATLYMCLT